MRQEFAEKHMQLIKKNKLMNALLKRESVTIEGIEYAIRLNETGIERFVMLVPRQGIGANVTLHNILDRWNFNPKSELCYRRMVNGPFDPKSELIPV